MPSLALSIPISEALLQCRKKYERGNSRACIGRGKIWHIKEQVPFPLWKYGTPRSRSVAKHGTLMAIYTKNMARQGVGPP